MILSGVAYAYLVTVGNTNFDRQLEAEAIGIGSQISSSLKIADETALQLAANDYIIRVFQGIQPGKATENFFSSNPGLDGEVKKFLLSYTIKSNPIGRICLFNDNGDFVFVGEAVDYSYVRGKSLEESFVTGVANGFRDSDAVMLFNVYNHDPLSTRTDSVLSVNRKVGDYLVLPATQVGYVQVQVPLRHVSRFFDPLSAGTRGYLVDAETNNIIYAHNDSENRGLPKSLDEENQSDWHVYIKSNELNDYNLRVVLIGSNDMLIQYAVSTFLWMLLLIAGIVALVAWGQTQIVKRTTRPIVELCELVQGLEVNGNLLPRIPDPQNSDFDELQNLNHAFNALVENLRDSMARYMGSHINELKAQMYALQAQMDPHFIHNLLSIISMMADNGESEKIPQVCEKLSEMNRYNSEFGDSFVTLSQEMDNATNYLELMKVRYEDQFCYHISYLSESMELLVPKFIIQPVVENCFKHGFRMKEFPWQIDLTLLVQEDFWQIEVRDNGTGMDQDKVAQLIEDCARIRQQPFEELMRNMKIGGLSLVNIYARLFMAYGDEMLFEVDTCENAGFFIRLGGKYDKSIGR